MLILLCINVLKRPAKDSASGSTRVLIGERERANLVVSTSDFSIHMGAVPSLRLSFYVILHTRVARLQFEISCTVHTIIFYVILNKRLICVFHMRAVTAQPRHTST